jgi:hypothetical protein
LYGLVQVLYEKGVFNFAKSGGEGRWEAEEH